MDVTENKENHDRYEDENESGSNEVFTSCHPENTYSIVVLGDLNVGKSVLCHHFIRTGQPRQNGDGRSENCEYEYDYPEDAVENSKGNYDVFETSMLIEGKESCLRLLDVNTEKQLLDNVEMGELVNLDACTDVCDGYMVVYSVTDRGTFRTAENILRILYDRELNKKQNLSVILVGNKTDLVRNRQVSSNDGMQLAERYSVKFIETSAMLNQNVKQLLHGSVKQINLRMLQNQTTEDGSPFQKAPKSDWKNRLLSSLRFRWEKSRANEQSAEKVGKTCAWSVCPRIYHLHVGESGKGKSKGLRLAKTFIRRMTKAWVNTNGCQRNCCLDLCVL